MGGRQCASLIHRTTPWQGDQVEIDCQRGEGMQQVRAHSKRVPGSAIGPLCLVLTHDSPHVP